MGLNVTTNIERWIYDAICFDLVYLAKMDSDMVWLTFQDQVYKMSKDLYVSIVMAECFVQWMDKESVQIDYYCTECTEPIDLDPVGVYQFLLDQSVKEENYEQAVIYRDALKKMEG